MLRFLLKKDYNFLQKCVFFQSRRTLINKVITEKLILRLRSNINIYVDIELNNSSNLILNNCLNQSFLTLFNLFFLSFYFYLLLFIIIFYNNFYNKIFI